MTAVARMAPDPRRRHCLRYLGDDVRVELTNPHRSPLFGYCRGVSLDVDGGTDRLVLDDPRGILVTVPLTKVHRITTTAAEL